MSEQMRKEFEDWMSDYGDSPKAIERNATGDYKLMQSVVAWRTWKAAWPAGAATQAPSAPVAPDEQKVELMRSGLALMVEIKTVKADHAKVLEDAYSALLWLHRRLPAAYKPLATVDQTIESIGRTIGYDARTDLAERAALSVKAEPAAIPEGWVLVPKEPDEMMQIRGDEATSRYVEWEAEGPTDGSHCAEMVDGIYKAMLDAAPTPPTTGEAVRIMVDSTVSMRFPSTMTDAERSQAIIDAVFPAATGEA